MLFDESGLIFLLLESFTTNITGSWTLTLIAFILFFMLVAFVFRLPVEFTALFVFPLGLYFTAYASSVMSIVGVLIFYLAFLLAKNFFFWK